LNLCNYILVIQAFAFTCNLYRYTTDEDTTAGVVPAAPPPRPGVFVYTLDVIRRCNPAPAEYGVMHGSDYGFIFANPRAWPAIVVGLYTMNEVDTSLESAWFRPLMSLQGEILVSLNAPDLNPS
jgi:hypothetical protein